VENQGDLSFFKKEILSESDYLTPLLIKSIDKGIWPMLKFNKKIRTLVKKRQRYLSMLSNQYGFRSATVTQQIDEWLTKLDLRVFALESVYKSSGNFAASLDNLILKRKNLFDYLEILKYNNLKHYKADPVRKIYISKYKNNTCPLKISTVIDLIVQTLFAQVIEPIIDAHADNNSFGFRKGRNPHQAIGLLSKFLHTNSEYQKHYSDKRYFTNSKYILNINIEKFFGKVNHNWLLENYPFPNKFINILEEWLSSEIIFQSEDETLISKFFQSSVIVPSFINFILNDLEKAIVPNKERVFNEKV
jgi:retron-type reverse transcriptase